MERHILEKLYAKLRLTYEEKEGWSFTDYVKQAKEKIKKKKWIVP